MHPPETGSAAPLFNLSDQDEKTFKLADCLGKFVVIYFYPKAMTSGCTTQACDLRDNWQKLLDLDVIVVGISADAPKLLNKFKAKENLPFILLSDPDHEVATRYGTWQEKSMYGRKYMGIARETFILDRSGSIIEVLRKVKPSTHVADVISAINKHSSQIT